MNILREVSRNIAISIMQAMAVTTSQGIGTEIFHRKIIVNFISA
jgi:hypothetical protein